MKFGMAFAAAAGIAAIKNNPGVLGGTFDQILKVGIGVLEKTGLAVMAIDWGGRIGAPMAATWESGAKGAEARGPSHVGLNLSWKLRLHSQAAKAFLDLYPVIVLSCQECSQLETVATIMIAIKFRRENAA